MNNIDNVLTIIKSLEELSEAGIRVFEDGKVGLSDIGEVPGLFSAFKTIAESLPSAREEIKELSVEEVQTISHELIRVIFGIVQYKEDAG